MAQSTTSKAKHYKYGTERAGQLRRERVEEAAEAAAETQINKGSLGDLAKKQGKPQKESEEFEEYWYEATQTVKRREEDDQWRECCRGPGQEKGKAIGD